MPPKKKMGQRGDDSDDEVSPAVAASLAAMNIKDGGKDKNTSKPVKETKKGNKKGTRGRDDSDDDMDPPVTAKKVEDDDFSKNAGKGGNKNKPAPSTQPTSKKDKKGKRGKGNDSSDEDPLSKMKALAGDSSDEESSKPVKAAQPVTKQANTSKAKKGKKGKNRDQDDDSDDDPLAKMKQIAGDEDELDEDEDYEIIDTPVIKPSMLKESPQKLKPVGDDVSDVNHDVDVAVDVQPKHEKVADIESSKPVSSSAQHVEKIHVVIESKPEPPVPTASSTSTIQPPQPPATSTSIAKLSTALAATQPTSTSAAAEPTPAASNKPKTALQLKMEKAKKAKEERDAAEVIAKAISAEEEKFRKIQEAEENARLQVERQQQAEAKRLQDEQDSAELKLSSESIASKQVPVLPAPTSVPTSAPAPVDPYAGLTEEEKLARLQSAMFGDDVHTEYGHVHVDEDAAGDATGKSKKKDRTSNKAKRRLAKEQESHDREEEYRIAMIKASIEGAQFACSQSAINADDPMWQNALDINIPSLTISAHNKELFSNAELSISHGRRYGLVGPNGAGKSTLLKMIAYGELKVPPRVDYLYVEQEVLADNTAAVDAVLKADKERWNLVQEEKEILHTLETSGPNETLDVRLGEIYEDLANMNASAAESKARRILFGLGFDAEMQIRPTKYFSGGWRMRISLARALFMEPTLLMLDEPTNHLDLNAVIWLDDYLQRWKKTLLVVSHDQDFLNSVCQEILHLEDKKLVVYKGNYDNFKEQEIVKRAQQQESWEKQERKIRQLKAKGITKSNAETEQLKSRSREPGARSQRKAEAAAVASGGVESGETQIELIKRPREYLVKFFFPEVNIINPPVLQIRDVSFRYGPHLPWLFNGLSFGLDQGSRVCIVGPNGSGKSTLLKLITGDLEPPDGMVVRNPRLRVGVYNQHFVDRLPMEEDPVAYLRRLFNAETYQSARNLLGKFGLEGHAHTIPIRDLSGGQKARVVFTELSLMAPHILFLDEPTNNLDIESIDALCDAIRLYNGGVVLVSHDARLIESTNCQLWVVEDQNVTPWVEGFSNYRAHLLRKLEDQLAVIMPGGGERPGEKSVTK